MGVSKILYYVSRGMKCFLDYVLNERTAHCKNEQWLTMSCGYYSLYKLSARITHGGYNRHKEEPMLTNQQYNRPRILRWAGSIFFGVRLL